jgi:tRNA (guanine37-N1)-methyltransferase
MQFDVLTLFPQMFHSFLDESIVKRAIKAKKIQVNLINFRDFAADKHKTVDDTPYGGGAGMVLKCQPIFDAFASIKSKKESRKSKTLSVFLTPQGKKLTQARVEKLAKYDQLVILCGHYEGVDQRVRNELIDEEISIGDYVLTGGELPAMVLIDAVSRLVPGVLGKEESHQQDSFSKSLKRKKEYPHYTKPAEFQGLKVPEVLLSGDHAEIEKWRHKHLK